MRGSNQMKFENLVATSKCCPIFSLFLLYFFTRNVTFWGRPSRKIKGVKIRTTLLFIYVDRKVKKAAYDGSFIRRRMPSQQAARLPIVIPPEEGHAWSSLLIRWSIAFDTPTHSLSLLIIRMIWRLQVHPIIPHSHIAVRVCEHNINLPALPDFIITSLSRRLIPD